MVEKEIEVVPVLKSSFKWLVKDPGFIGLYLLPVVVSLLAFTHAYLTFGIPGVSSKVSVSEFQAILIGKIWWILLYVISAVVLSLIANAGIILKATAREKGKSISFTRAVTRAVPYVPRLFVAIIINGLIVVGPFFAFILLGILGTPILMIGALIWFLPMLYIGVRLLLFSQACVIEDSGPVECLKKSWHATKNKFWLIFVTSLLLGIISMVISLIPRIFLEIMSTTNILIPQIGGIIATLLVGPAGLIAFTLIYLGLSGRTERIIKK